MLAFDVLHRNDLVLTSVFPFFFLPDVEMNEKHKSNETGRTLKRHKKNSGKFQYCLNLLLFHHIIAIFDAKWLCSLSIVA